MPENMKEIDNRLVDKELSAGLVIFTKNEEKTIGEIIDEACNYINKENIFIIDGHSTDATAAIARKKGVKLFYDTKKGKGSAVQLALDSVAKDILIFMDSDGSHRLEEIPALVGPFLTDKDMDMVIGSRFKGDSEELYGSIHEIIRFCGNKISTFLVNLIWGARLTDIHNGFRAVRREAVRKLILTENSFAIEQEMVIKCLKNRNKITEIPSWELKRKYNSSHLVPSEMVFRCALSFIRNIF